jgi:hypothetical protein
VPAVPRFLTRKVVVVPVAIVVVAVGAFEGYAAYTRAKPVDYARGGDLFAAVPTATPRPVVGASGTPAPTATSRASASPTALPRVDVTSFPTPVPTVTPVASTAPTALLAVPRIGTYQLAVSGSEKVKFGVVSFCNQTLPTRTHLVVSKAAGESATSYDFDIPYFPGNSGQHDERHIYRYTPTGTFLDYEIATVTCQGVRQSSSTSFAPPQLRARLPLTVGASWTNHGGDADRTESSSSKVARTETLTVGGQRVPTYVLDTTTSFTGSESGSRTQTWWYSPAWAMPVKWTEQINGQRSGASYSEDVTVTVLSRP